MYIGHTYIRIIELVKLLSTWTGKYTIPFRGDKVYAELPRQLLRVHIMCLLLFTGERIEIKTFKFMLHEQRHLIMLRMIKAGYNITEISELLCMSRERVHQIYKKHERARTSKYRRQINNIITSKSTTPEEFYWLEKQL